ncbi:MAG: response regulator transcription factor [Thermoanaerobaculales bacterium]|jgi:DNA-binding NarL/FixJ family response regulator|nr:response regulator transcription factor [Thermoanaerobaculales bacterium]
MNHDATLAVGLVEDDRRFRGVLQMLMEGTPEFDLAFATGSVEEALRITPQLRPRVILLDVHLPGMSGIEGVGIIQERFPESVVLMLTVFEDEDRIFEALCNGAGGYLLKKTPPARLLEYVSEAATGGAPMSPEIAAKVVRLFARLPKKVALDENLTPQETSFLKLLAEGHSYASSASELGVSVNTVRNYVRSIYDKLHVHSKSEAVSKAMRAGLI